MRILFVVSNLPTQEYPEPVFKLRTIQSFRHTDVEVYVFDIEAQKSRWNYVFKMNELRRKLKEIKPDIVHSMGVYANIVTLLQRYPVHVAEFLSEFELIGQKRFHLKQLKKQTQQGLIPDLAFKLTALLNKSVFRRAQAIIVKSKRMFDLVPAKFQHLAKIIPHGVNMDEFCEMDRQKAREVLGISKEETVVLFLGNAKNPCKRYGLAKGALENVFSLGLYKNKTIKLYGLNHTPPELVPYWMNAADVGIFTSITEGSPNVIKEALACNLPFVSTDVGDVRERIRNIPGPQLAESDSIEEISSCLQKVLEKPERLNAREIIMQEVDAKKIAYDHIALYQSLT
jgi:glycosyltransferase involved in cell wall biosynthesis